MDRVGHHGVVPALEEDIAVVSCHGLTLRADAICPSGLAPVTGQWCQILRGSLRGRPAILAFYPADWSPVCSDQMALYQEVMPMFEAFGAALVGISVDGVWCHRAFADDRNIRFPLLSDFEPKGAVSAQYNAYRTGEGVSERALFVLDPQGAVHWSELSPPMQNPGAAGILQALDDMAGTPVPS